MLVSVVSTFSVIWFVTVSDWVTIGCEITDGECVVDSQVASETTTQCEADGFVVVSCCFVAVIVLVKAVDSSCAQRDECEWVKKTLFEFIAVEEFVLSLDSTESQTCLEFTVCWVEVTTFGSVTSPQCVNANVESIVQVTFNRERS